MPNLTKRQKQVFDYLKFFIEKKGYSPTVEETRKHFKLSAISTVHEHLQTLEEKGVIKKNEHQARSIDIVQKENTFEVPIVGTIAAGQPIEAIEFAGETITITKDEVSKFGNLYALRVAGNSMIDEGIFDGDVVVVRRQEYADNGQTVVAVIDENEATLKKLYREKNQFRLQPANPQMLPLFRTEVEIRGVVVKIIRTLESQIEKEKANDEKYIRRIDYSWDFRGENTKTYTHGLHTYPAMFIPQVARRLLETYTNKGDLICDIFCGSGTALVESRLLGRNAHGIDLNPLAIFLANVKTTEINPSNLTKEYFELLKRIDKIKDKDIKIPKFFNIEFWFNKKVITELAKIKTAIKKTENKKIKNFFMIAFSEIIRKASNTKTGEFKLVRIKAEKLKNHNPNVLALFKKKLEGNIAVMKDFYDDVDKNTKVNIIFGDSSKNNNIQPNSIDCIITSPPYGDSRTTVAYGQFSRLSSQWIDIFEEPNDASKVDNELLGGKASKNLVHNLESYYLKESLEKIAKKDEKRARDVLSFYVGLNDCLKQAHKMLKPKKYFCLVIGNRLVKQVRIPTDFIIAELSENIGFSCEDIFIRNIPGKRMPIKNSPTNIVGELEETMNKESIVILRKN